MFLAPVEFLYFGEATNSDPKKHACDMLRNELQDLATYISYNSLFILSLCDCMYYFCICFEDNSTKIELVTNAP